MSIHVHNLAGCSPVPLANYLKALGVLRLVAEQKDPSARGWWKDESFHLATTLDRNELEKFFLEEYAPTPMLNPWGARSGYYSGSSESSSRENLLKIVKKGKETIRLKDFTKVFKVARKILKQEFQCEKPKSDEDSNRLLRRLRHSVCDKTSAWMDTCIVGLQDKVVYPAIFGTGASEGSGSYTSTYMFAIKTAIVDCKADVNLLSCLWGTPCPNSVWNQTFGHFIPSGIGGPWDLLMAFEGICVVRSGVTSVSRPNAVKWISSPFYVAPVASGYSSSSVQDEVAVNKGKKMPGRGEQWFPLWDRPLLFGEAKNLFSHGKASVKRKAAMNGIDVATAIADYGVERGIGKFVRYGYLQRNNLATHFAVPLGYYHVAEKPSNKMALLSEIQDWLANIRRNTRESHTVKNPPVSLQSAERAATTLYVALTQEPDAKPRWLQMLLALAGIERQLVSSGKFTKDKRLPPIPSLSPGWVEAADDGSCEFRLALALANQSANGHGSDSIRHHWMPLDKFDRFATDQSGLRKDPRVVCHGLDGERDLIALVRRRIVEGEQNKGRRFPMIATRHCVAYLPDMAAFLAGVVDVQRIIDLARALMALDFRHLSRAPTAPAGDEPPPLYGLFRLACLPWPLVRGGVPIEIRVDPAIIQRLAAGDLEGAGNLAIRRLVSSGLTPVIRHVGGNDPRLARRLTASLAFPISGPTATKLSDQLTKPTVNNKKGSVL